MKKPLVSIILPVYNGEHYLKEAIDSILAQTFTNFELIIINDGSSDDSFNIAQNFASVDERIVLISQENIGLIATLNKGISIAKGAYIARMDQDDISLDKRLYEQVHVLNNGYDICGCHFYVIDESGRLVDSYVMPCTEDAFSVVLSQGVPFAHGSVMFKRSFWDVHSLHYSDKIYRHAEDYLLWTRFHECGAKMHNVDQFLFKYRWFSESLSKTNAISNKNDAYAISKIFIKKNRVALLSIIDKELSKFTPFELEYACTTLFYLLLTCRFNIKIKIFNRIPMKIKLTSLFKSILMIIKR